VVGVELSADLAEIAQANAERWQRMGQARSSIRVLHQDAMQFCWRALPCWRSVQSVRLRTRGGAFWCVWKSRTARAASKGRDGRRAVERDRSAVRHPTCGTWYQAVKWVLLWTIGLIGCADHGRSYGTTLTACRATGCGDSFPSAAAGLDDSVPRNTK